METDDCSQAKAVKDHRSMALWFLVILVILSLPLYESFFPQETVVSESKGDKYVRFYVGGRLRHVTLSSANAFLGAHPDQSLRLIDELSGRLIWTGTADEFRETIIDTAEW